MKNLSQIEREFFQRKTNSQASKPLNEMKIVYMGTQVGGYSKGEKLESLTQRWLRKLIVDNLGSPVGNRTSDLLKQALASLGYPVTNLKNQNWKTLYSKLP